MPLMVLIGSAIYGLLSRLVRLRGDLPYRLEQASTVARCGQTSVHCGLLRVQDCLQKSIPRHRSVKARIRCALPTKGTPVARRGRKARGLSETAQLPKEMHRCLHNSQPLSLHVLPVLPLYRRRLCSYLHRLALGRRRPQTSQVSHTGRASDITQALLHAASGTLCVSEMSDLHKLCAAQVLPLY